MEPYDRAYDAGIRAASRCTSWSDPDLPMAGDAESERALGMAWAEWWASLPAFDGDQVCFAMLAFRAGFLAEPPPWRGGMDPRLEPFFEGLRETWSDSDL